MWLATGAVFLLQGEILPVAGYRHLPLPLGILYVPHLIHLAPDWLHWYYRQANISGPDVFALPPSGHLYAYPGMMPADMQARLN